MSDDDPRPPDARRARMERELKLLAPGGLGVDELVPVARAAGFETDGPRVHAHVDRYLDTDAYDLARVGLGLRLRVRGREAQLGVKLRGDGPVVAARARARDALWQRVEVELPVSAAAKLPAVAAELPEALRHRVEPFALAHPLREIARLETERALVPLRDAETGGEIELTLDHVEIPGPGRTLRFAEVEAEAAAGTSNDLLARLAPALARGLGLVPSTQDKLERALSLLGAEPPAPWPARLFPDTPLREAALRVLRRAHAQLREAEPVARVGEDPEGVHRMRVATRRMRAAMKLFEGALAARSLSVPRRHLERTADALGAVRDLDVMLLELPRVAEKLPGGLGPDLEPLRDVLHVLDERARKRLVGWLLSPARLRGEDRFLAFLAPPPSPGRGAASRPVGEVAPFLVADAAQRVFKRGEKLKKGSPARDLHRLRLAVKHLRYTVEALADVLDHELDALLERMTHLQDVLGRFNDATVAGAHLAEWIDTPLGRRLPRRTLLAAGALLARYEQRATKARGEFREAWGEFATGRTRREIAGLGAGA
ncbi:MAG TPA: CHAD domain-containing protein [Myxococcota bacterium]|nr:CHAD domain-containing protein [Myxococcota bacterium]